MISFIVLFLFIPPRHASETILLYNRDIKDIVLFFPYNCAKCKETTHKLYLTTFHIGKHNVEIHKKIFIMSHLCPFLLFLLLCVLPFLCVFCPCSLLLSLFCHDLFQYFSISLAFCVFCSPLLSLILSACYSFHPSLLFADLFSFCTICNVQCEEPDADQDQAES